MAEGGDSAAGRDWTVKEVDPQTPLNRKNLAYVLQQMCRFVRDAETLQLPGSSVLQREMAERLYTSETSLSRYLSGGNVPPADFVKRLYAACENAGYNPGEGGSLEYVQALRTRAETERRCAHCLQFSREIEQLQDELVAARREAGTRNKAGWLSRSRAGETQTQLPVPRGRGDRQLSQNDVAAARALAERSEVLVRSGNSDQAHMILRQSASVLSPLEAASVLVLLRNRQQDELAENLIHVYGRDQSHEAIMRASLALHEEGAADDAGALLRAAVGRLPATAWSAQAASAS
ncbi:hypothetical protein [Streptomyces sp. MJP52]|uniref:hypothetical protein n=1 Tax=Streptomyces sp. MJP52 TaxID=2940555 RepID=UPI002476EBBB|nr:hypothetical protein [Streptomyces sp. MJP52]MDH6226809.1 transcriptional regulator with XRE-family HTH domain [Streptomyces sp. MJP52]